MNKKTPVYRTSIVTRKKYLKSDLFRVTKTKEGEVKFDLNQNIEGRGVYIEKDLSLIKLASDKHLLNRGLRIEVPSEIYTQMINELSKTK